MRLSSLLLPIFVISISALQADPVADAPVRSDNATPLPSRPEVVGDQPRNTQPAVGNQADGSDAGLLDLGLSESNVVGTINTNRFQGLIVKSVEIDGKIIIASRDVKEKPQAADDCLIEVVEMDKDITVAYTRTDSEGRFKIPKIPLGDYRLYTGRLLLHMRVVPEEYTGGAARKRIVVVVPSTLAFDAKRHGESDKK